MECKDKCQNVVGDGRNKHKIYFQGLWHSGKNVSVAVSSRQSRPKQKQWVFSLLRLLFLIIPKLLRIKQYPIFSALWGRGNAAIFETFTSFTSDKVCLPLKFVYEIFLCLFCVQLL